MIHSASFLATGSDIAASVWVASTGLCLRTSSMTVSSASVSACEVDDGAATAACGAGLRAGAGGKAACWRVAGAIAGATGTVVATAAVFLAAALAAGAVVLVEALSVEVLSAEALSVEALSVEALSVEALSVEALSVEALSVEALSVEALSTRVRAIGRGFGSGTFGAAQAAAAHADNPTARARPMST